MPNITLAAARRPAATIVTSIIEVSAGREHFIVRRSDDTTWAWGDGNVGGLGINATTRTVCTPTLVVGGRTFCQIVAGYYASAGVQTSDKLGFSWGDSSFGYGGRGNVTNVSSPVAITGGYSYSKIVATSNPNALNMAALTVGGTAYAWGRNQFGEAGDGSTVTSKISPVPVCCNYSYCDIAARCGAFLGLNYLGNIYGWGSRSFGGLGDGTALPVCALQPVAACNASDGSNVYSRIAAGDLHVLVINATGKAFAFGLNSTGQLGDNTTASKCTPTAVCGNLSFCRIAAGINFSFGITTGGTAYAWGANTNGNLGFGDLRASEITPVSVCTTLQFCEIAAGGFQTIAISYSGDVYTWGLNRYGQLGTGKNGQCWTPIQMPNFSTNTTNRYAVAMGPDQRSLITTGGTAFSWGKGTLGAIGNNTVNTPGFYDEPTQVCGTTGLTGITRGEDYAITWTSGGTAYAWGSGSLGRLGVGTAICFSTPQAVCGSGLCFVKVAAFYRHTLALTRGGTGYAWGNNQFGQLGTFGTSCFSQPTIFHTSGNFSYCDISPGVDHSLAVRDDGGGTGGTGYSWGNNATGQLGDGNTVCKQTPAVILARKFCRVAAGSSFSVGITNGGTMVAWGNNSSGQLGDNSITSRRTPVLVCGLTGLTFCDVAAGYTHVLALTTGGTVWAWGSSTWGELGNDIISARCTAVAVCHVGISFVSVAANNNGSMAVDATGGIYVWGDGTWGQLGNGSGPRTTPVSVNI